MNDSLGSLFFSAEFWIKLSVKFHFHPKSIKVNAFEHKAQSLSKNNFIVFGKGSKTLILIKIGAWFSESSITNFCPRITTPVPPVTLCVGGRGAERSRRGQILREVARDQLLCDDPMQGMQCVRTSAHTWKRNKMLICCMNSFFVCFIETA